jgi:hypothetical protein
MGDTRMKTSTFGPIKIPYLYLLMLLAVATTGAETFDGREIKTAGWNGYTIEYVDGHILVKHKAGVQESELNDLFQSPGITVARQFVGSQWLRVDAGVNGDIFGIITHLLESPLIERRAGFYAETFDASQLPSGVYVYRLSFGSVAATKKLLLMK